MRNANIFVDVDLTLVDVKGRLLVGAVDSLRRLSAAGCHLFLWSSAGSSYARAVAERHGLLELFEGFTAKPDIVIDDLPGTTRAPFTFSVGAERSWGSVAEEILTRHLDLGATTER